MFQKSGDAFKEIGLDIWNSLETRADKATDSWYDFGNYLTLGSLDLGKNMGAGLRYNTENRMNSPLDFINWMTIGGVDTINAVVFPEESFSKDHWVSSFNLATLIAGGANARIVNTSTPNVSTKVPSVEKTPKTTSVPLVTRLPRLNTLTNIQEWFRVNMPEIGLVYDNAGGYHFMMRKGDGGGSGGSGVKDGKGTGKKIDSDLIKKYIRDIEGRTGRQLPKNQIEKLKEALRNREYNKLSPIETRKHRRAFNKVKSKLIEEWETKTGQKWPTYAEDVISEKTGEPVRRVGDKYDAHHIIDNSFQGEHEWWNIHPAKFPNEHQSGIHGTGSPANELFKGGK